MIPFTFASLRADLCRELARLACRPMEGGPYIAWREGALLASWPDAECVVTPVHVEALKRLPDRAGVDVVAGVLAERAKETSE